MTLKDSKSNKKKEIQESFYHLRTFIRHLCFHPFTLWHFQNKKQHACCKIGANRLFINVIIVYYILGPTILKS